MKILIQVVGWIGTFLIVLAYFLVSHKKIDSSNKYYQLMNFFGAIGIGINVFYQRAWAAVVLQIVWGIIAIFFLIRKKQS